MVRAIGSAATVITVLAGWFLMLLWMVLSVSQMAVERTAIPAVSCLSDSQEPGCEPPF